MRRFIKVSTAIVLCSVSITKGYAQQKKGVFADRATQTMDIIYSKYGNEVNALLSENYPFDDSFKADYLDNSVQAANQKKYAYLWPFSGSLSAVNVLMELPNKKKTYQKVMDDKVLIGLEAYRDASRAPVGYASYINTAPASDRFYDDNVWLGIDFADTYLQTKNKKYLQSAKEIWDFVLSGEDDKLGGGIYWCEQKKESKNTCSNAPAVVFALKMYEATGNKLYLKEGERLYAWTKNALQDPSDKLYWDNVNLNGKVDKAKYSYNSGQMLQSAALLYKITKDKKYLHDAQELAAACLDYFFQENEDVSFPVLRNSNLWFHAVMMRGFVSLYEEDGNSEYLDIFANNLDRAWKDWTLNNKKKSKWLLDQCAFVEMYARLAGLGY